MSKMQQLPVIPMPCVPTTTGMPSRMESGSTKTHSALHALNTAGASQHCARAGRVCHYTNGSVFSRWDRVGPPIFRVLTGYIFCIYADEIRAEFFE